MGAQSSSMKNSLTSLRWNFTGYAMPPCYRISSGAAYMGHAALTLVPG